MVKPEVVPTVPVIVPEFSIPEVGLCVTNWTKAVSEPILTLTPFNSTAFASV